MKEEDKKLLENRILELNKEPGGVQAIKFIANSIGGPLGAITTIYNEINQKEINDSLLNLFLEHDDDINNILKILKNNLNEATRSSLSLLFGETLNIELPQSYDDLINKDLQVVLHSDTVGEFKEFEKKGWITMHSNKNQVSMGCGNRAGNDYEDLKRPYGMGIGFVITINESLYDIKY